MKSFDQGRTDMKKGGKILWDWDSGIGNLQFGIRLVNCQAQVLSPKSQSQDQEDLG